MNKVDSRLWTKISNEIATQVEGFDQYFMNKLTRKLYDLDLIEPAKIIYPKSAIDRKMDQGKHILISLGLPEKVVGRMCILTFIALCDQKPSDNWKRLKIQSMGLTNGIMKFVTDYYNMEYKTGTRENFRREGINLLLNYSIIDLNPDNSNLGPNSPLTHYAIKQSVLNKINAKNP